MLILPDYGKPYIIDSLTAPVMVKHHWAFNAQLCDFVLSKITYLEETTGPGVKIRVNNFEFWVPSCWNILVTDHETYQLDTVPIPSCATTQYFAYSFSPTEMNLRTLEVRVIDYSDKISAVHPMINKATALVHPVGPVTQPNGSVLQLAVVMGPHDLHKYIGNKVVGDLLTH